MLCMEFAIGGGITSERQKKKKTDAAFSSFFAVSGGMDQHNRNIESKYRASVTIEATMVLTVVMLGIAVLISQIYQLHDTITGTMILEETVMHVRTDSYESKKRAETEAESYGKKLGNPRLWLGEYEIEMNIGFETISGTARAGNWEQEIVIKQFHPGNFLREYEKILEIGEKLNDDRCGIQEGNES